MPAQLLAHSPVDDSSEVIFGLFNIITAIFVEATLRLRLEVWVPGCLGACVHGRVGGWAGGGGCEGGCGCGRGRGRVCVCVTSCA